MTRVFSLLLASFAGELMAEDQSPEIVVVSVSRAPQSISEAPAAVTVITAESIDRTPADDFGDLLRNVPGVNVAQLSVRDINIISRGSSRTLSNSQLVLLDGRSIYLDFFGIVLWDLVPVLSSEIARIEVVRGPGSAVWGANAMSGVTNIITARPKDIPGTTVAVGTPWINIVHAAGDADFAYKISAGYIDQPAYERPTGTIPGSKPSQTYPYFANEGTTQRRANVRFDWGMDDAYFTFGFGGAATDGIIHTGIGPFNIDNVTELGYLQADWHRNNAHVGISAQFLDGEANNLLTRSSTGEPLGFEFVNDTYNIDLSNSSSIGNRHFLTYGGNLREHNFQLDIAPLANDKTEFGMFIQDEIHLNEKWRWVVGIRYDDIDPLRATVITPRTSLLYSFSLDHSLRISYNEAFRTPSAINNFLAISILQPLAPDVAAVADAFGDIKLREEQLRAYEIGYAGYLNNGMGVTVSAYRNETRDWIDFFTADLFGPSNLPAPGPTLPASLIRCFAHPPGTDIGCPLGGIAGVVPSAYSYRNIGETIDSGVEFSIDQDRGEWYWWANASWQDDPVTTGADPADVNRAPDWRVNLGLGKDVGRLFWNASINYQGESYWADVLFARAPTDAFTAVNASVGWRFQNETLTLKLIGQNLFDEKLLQHVFGDIIDRKIAAQVSFSF
jgi:iron complex outermembrane receptor protein